MRRTTGGSTKHALGVVLVELFKLAQGPVHPVGLAFKKRAGKAGLGVVTVHCGENIGVRCRRRGVGVRPWRGIVLGSMVLMGHYCHLVKMDLWYIRVRGGVDVFGGN